MLFPLLGIVGIGALIQGCGGGEVEVALPPEPEPIEPNRATEFSPDCFLKDKSLLSKEIPFSTSLHEESRCVLQNQMTWFREQGVPKTQPPIDAIREQTLCFGFDEFYASACLPLDGDGFTQILRMCDAIEVYLKDDLSQGAAHFVYRNNCRASLESQQVCGGMVMYLAGDGSQVIQPILESIFTQDIQNQIERDCFSQP